jgi:integrase/recombinase XerD
MNGKCLTEIMTELLDHMAARRFSRYTVKQNWSGIRLFLRWLEETHGVVTPERLRRVHLESWQQHLAGLAFKGRPLRPRSVNKRIETVRNLLRHLADKGYISGHLEKAVDYVKEPKVLPGSVLNHVQVRAMLENVATDTPAGYRNRAMLELLYTSGIRAAELLGLDVRDVDFANGTARVLGKGQKERMVPVGRTALGVLENYVKGVRPFLLKDAAEQALFLDDFGHRHPYHTLLRLIHEVAKRSNAPVNVTPHTFRRSCTTELLRGGAGMYHVKELLGHDSLDTLKHYAKLTITDLKREHQRCHPREKDTTGERMKWSDHEPGDAEKNCAPENC